MCYGESAMVDTGQTTLAQVRNGEPNRDIEPKSLTVLGSTGSVGVNTLDLVARMPDAFRVSALVANRNLEGLVEQALNFRPQIAHQDALLSAQYMSTIQKEEMNCYLISNIQQSTYCAPRIYV